MTVSETTQQHVGWLKQYIEGMTAENWADMRLRCERQLSDLSAALSDQAGGWQLVPKEPTQAMRLAGVAEYARTDAPLSEAPTIVFDRIYKAMIAAAPPPSSTV